MTCTVLVTTLPYRHRWVNHAGNSRPTMANGGITSWSWFEPSVSGDFSADVIRKVLFVGCNIINNLKICGNHGRSVTTTRCRAWSMLQQIFVFDLQLPKLLAADYFFKLPGHTCLSSPPFNSAVVFSGYRFYSNTTNVFTFTQNNLFPRGFC